MKEKEAAGIGNYERESKKPIHETHEIGGEGKGINCGAGSLNPAFVRT
jgi:hypothetical protein